VLVAEIEGRIVGTFQLTYLRQLTLRGGLVAQIEAVRVAAPLRSRGLGAEMMRWAMGEARARGCARMQLTSDKRREDAHRFYRRLGFKQSHEGFKYYFD
jgi:GNAT superfamily N-acetyltransferase